MFRLCARLPTPNRQYTCFPLVRAPRFSNMAILWEWKNRIREGIHKWMAHLTQNNVPTWESIPCPSHGPRSDRIMDETFNIPFLEKKGKTRSTSAKIGDLGTWSDGRLHHKLIQTIGRTIQRKALSLRCLRKGFKNNQWGMNDCPQHAAEMSRAVSWLSLSLIQYAPEATSTYPLCEPHQLRIRRKTSTS